MEFHTEPPSTLFVTVFEAIERQIKALCLNDFPCGVGSWRDDTIPRKKVSNKLIGKTKSLKAVKRDAALTQNGADKENVETLQELIRSESSPWHFECTWTDEGEKLKNLAVKIPWHLSDETIFSYLSSVRIYDQGVTSIDKHLLKLTNLEELSLSANYISSVSSANLPRILKRLELHANKITDVSELCVNPPPLEHLGLGRNFLTWVDKHITGSNWPKLLSLDISHNDLCDIIKVISALETLPKLRHLVMNGNPLSLIPAYRGFTIDSLKHLMVFDDKHLSVDEKISFQNVSKALDRVIEEARIQIEIPYVKGLPCPDEIKFKDNQPDYPLVDRQYFIQFMFIEEKPKTVSVVIFEAAEQLKLMKSESTNDVQEMIAEGLTQNGHSESLSPTMNEEQEKKDSAYNIEMFPVADDINKDKNSELALNRMISESVIPERCSQKHEVTPTSSIRLIPVQTRMFSWAPEQNLNIMIDLRRNNLLAVRDFFKQGMDFSLMEHLVLSHPTGHESKEDKGGKGKGNKSAQKEKILEKPKSAQKKEVKKKKDDVDLAKSEPVVSTVASFHIPLENLLDGDFVCKKTFTAQELPAPTPAIPNDPDKNNSKTKDKRRDSTSPSDKNKNAKKTPTKDDKKKRKSFDVAMESLPEELQLEVIVKLQHWTSAKDAFQNDNTDKIASEGLMQL
ncbi:Leucine-rich repeat-containing protein 43 [Bulinus truncatus]|nr:Leucine-rich repeat-containing protein 43 [Bulinus truncatus]